MPAHFEISWPIERTNGCLKRVASKRIIITWVKSHTEEEEQQILIVPFLNVLATWLTHLMSHISLNMISLECPANIFVLRTLRVHKVKIYICFLRSGLFFLNRFQTYSPIHSNSLCIQNCFTWISKWQNLVGRVQQLG